MAKMLALRAVLFDAGNTLLDLDYRWLAEMGRSLGARDATPQAIAVAGARLLRQNSGLYGHTPAPSEAGAVFRSSFAAIGRAVGLADGPAEEFARAAEDENRSDARGLWRRLVPAARATLAALQARGLRLGVISNSDGQAERHLALAGLRDVFEVVVDSALVGLEKPDVRIFAYALGRLQAEPADAVYVGDLLDIDVRGARRAGLHALLYDPWDVYPDVPESRIRGLGQLLELVDRERTDDTQALRRPL